MGLLSPVPQRRGLLGMLSRPDDMAYQTGSVIPTMPMRAPPADAGDEYFLRQQGQSAPSPQMGMTPPQPQGLLPAPQTPSAGLLAPQRPRVSGWRLLDRVLGGETITGGLDAERERLRTEALRPQAEAENARIQSAIRGLPMEQQLAIMFNKDKAGEAFASQFTDRPAAAGTSIVRGGNPIYTTPTTTFDGGRFATLTPGMGGNPAEVSYSEARPMSAVEETARINVTNPISVAANANLVDPITRQTVNEGYRPPNITNIAAGGEAIVTDAQGNVTNRVASTQERPIPDKVRQDNERDQTAIDARAVTISRLDNAIALIKNNTINLDPSSRASAWVRNATGNSSPQSQAQAELRRTVETLRNQILNDATGPQTDGDSLRALNQILSGWGDETVVRQGIAAYRDIQQAKTASQQRIMEGRMAQYSQPQGGASAAAQGPIATNPTTGEQVQWNGSAWVPI